MNNVRRKSRPQLDGTEEEASSRNRVVVVNLVEALKKEPEKSRNHDRFIYARVGQGV